MEQDWGIPSFLSFWFFYPSILLTGNGFLLSVANPTPDVYIRLVDGKTESEKEQMMREAIR